MLIVTWKTRKPRKLCFQVLTTPHSERVMFSVLSPEVVSCFINSENWRFHFQKNKVVLKLRLSGALSADLKATLGLLRCVKFSVKALVLN